MTSQEIREGDYVLLYLSWRKTYLVQVKKGKNFHTHKGFIPFDDLIGQPFGSSVLSNIGAKFIALKPSIRDYIFKSTRKTQIIYPKDVSLIVMFSGIEPGSRVVEAGTGTGALTTALAHYVRPEGKIFSYDVKSSFLKTAKKNLNRSGLSDFVELKNKDVTKGIIEDLVDAVVLDLATPWLVIPHAYDSLKPSGTLVSFSPTIDQVVKTVEALKENGFVNVETIECLMRGMQIERGKTRPQTMMTGHTGYITSARKSL
ncbi:MAG: tRNA (adenine-N1)-methyltransferase [Thermoproteota archaeon]